MLNENNLESDPPELTFAYLKIGDFVNTLAEITHIKQDETHAPPRWTLYTLFDGYATIRAFAFSEDKLHVGDLVEIEFEVQDGKPYRNQPQLAFKVHLFRLIPPGDARYPSAQHKLRYHSILRKKDLLAFHTGARVQLYTCITKLLPPDQPQSRYRNARILDADYRTISLWFPMESLPLFEAIQEGEYFVLQTTVRTVEHNPKARYLAFEMLLRGKDLADHPIVQQYYWDRIKSLCTDLYSELDHWRTKAKNLVGDLKILYLLLDRFNFEEIEELIGE